MSRLSSFDAWIMLWGAAAAVAVATVASPCKAQVTVRPTAFTATMQVTSWRDIPFRTVVRQEYDFSCGSAAVATLLTYHYGRKTDETEVFKAMFAVGDQAKIRRLGFSMLDMKRYLENQGMKAEGYRMSLKDLAEQKTPMIVLMDLGRYRHFVVLKGVRDGHVLVGDPALGLRVYPIDQFAKMWNGIAFGLDPEGQVAAKFNVASEWQPWSVAPTAASFRRRAISNITNDQMTLYQITPMRVIDIASISAGVPQ